MFFLGSFHDTFRNTDPSALESDELASDGIIMDLTYSPERYADPHYISQTPFEIYETTKKPFVVSYISHFICSYNMNYNFGPLRGSSIIVIFVELYLEKAFTTNCACYIVDHRCNSSGFSFMCV